MGCVLSTLQAEMGDTLLLQHTHTADNNIMHVTASLRRRQPVCEEPEMSASATANCSMGEFSWEADDVDDEVQQPKAPTAEELAAFMTTAALGAVRPHLVCTHCGREYTYRGPFYR